MISRYWWEKIVLLLFQCVKKSTFLVTQNYVCKEYKSKTKKLYFTFIKLPRLKNIWKITEAQMFIKKNFAILTAMLRYFVSAFLRIHLQLLNQHKKPAFSIPAMFSAYTVYLCAKKRTFSNPLKKLFSFEIQCISFKDRFSK